MPLRLLGPFSQRPRLAVGVFGVLGAAGIAIGVAAATLPGGGGDAGGSDAGGSSAGLTSTPEPSAAGAGGQPGPLEVGSSREVEEVLVQEQPIGILDGVPITPELAQQRGGRLPLAVIIDNDPDARPQHGLTEAELVYEALVEGGVTRYLAVFWRNEPDRLGPLRSARVYFLDWAIELDAVFAHAGTAFTEGPADALGQIQQLDVRDLDCLRGSGLLGCERDPGRPAPSDVMVGAGNLWQFAEVFGWAGPPALELWIFKDDTPGVGETPAEAIEVKFSQGGGGSFAVRWEYDLQFNVYQRFLGGQPHTDAGSGAPIVAKNVVVQFTTLRVLDDADRHVLYGTIGEGAALLFRDGVVIEGTWRKASREERTKFFDAAGNEVAFNRGPTWIEVVPPAGTVTY